MDSFMHGVVADSYSDLSSEPFEKGKSFNYTFEINGTYDYHCGLHQAMKGKIIVE